MELPSTLLFCRDFCSVDAHVCPPTEGQYQPALFWIKGKIVLTKLPEYGSRVFHTVSAKDAGR